MTSTKGRKLERENERVEIFKKMWLAQEISFNELYFEIAQIKGHSAANSICSDLASGGRL